MDRVRSLPLQVDVEPGSRTELIIQGRAEKISWWKMFLPIALAGLISQPIAGVLLQAMSLVEENWWIRTGVPVVVYFIMTGYVWMSSIFSSEYWAMWKLELVKP